MARAERHLNGLVAVVTGGARGIGRAIAEALSAEGMTVAIADLDATLAQQTAAELGPRVHAFAVDVTSLESIEGLLDEVQDALGPIDVHVNNAGIMLTGAFLEQGPRAAEKEIGVNVDGVVNGSRAAAARMTARGTGHIVNIASGAAKVGYPGIAVYCGSKYFVLGFSEALRGELRPSGVEVSCVMPSFVNTELASGLGDVVGFKKLHPDDVAAAVVGALKRPRFAVYVPRSMGSMLTIAGLLPRRARDVLDRVSGAGSLCLTPDAAARASYLQRSLAETAEQAGERVTAARR